MRATILLVGAISLFAMRLAAGADGTVGLRAYQIYSDRAPDKLGPAVVVEVMEGTPAVDAGVREGGFIVGIDGKDCVGKSAVEALRTSHAGPTGGHMFSRQSEGRQFEPL